MAVEWHIETRAVADLKAHPKNPRAFTAKGLADLEKSVDRFGLAEPIVINTDGLVIGGHARLHVLRSRGAVECDCYVPSKTLTPKQCDELNIRLNANIAGEWDFDILANEWDATELTEWGLDVDMPAVTGDADAEPQIDRAEELREQWGVHTGQLWQLGEHRLLCGDSTKPEDVERVMGGEKIGGIVADPPYGLGIDGQKKSVCKNPKHNRKAHEFRGWDDETPSRDFFDSLLSIGAPSAIFGGNYVSDKLPASRGWVYWSKGQDGALTMSDGELVWTSMHKPLRSITVNRAALMSQSDHPTQKPTRVVQFVLDYIECSAGAIYDPFCGSGTTVIVCEQLNRKCRAIEISPAYVAVTLQRYLDATGKEPKLIA